MCADVSNIIVAFPKKEVAVKIRNILARGGIDTYSVCTTGAQVLQSTDSLDDGLVICGYRLPDMMYEEIRECLPDTFELLLIASPEHWESGIAKGVVGLAMPIKVYDLLNTVEMMLQAMQRRRKRRRELSKKRSPQQRAVINEAKALLMDRNHMTEAEAHRYLQKNSMDSGTNMLETAQMVLTIMSE